MGYIVYNRCTALEDSEVLPHGFQFGEIIIKVSCWLYSIYGYTHANICTYIYIHIFGTLLMCVLNCMHMYKYIYIKVLWWGLGRGSISAESRQCDDGHRRRRHHHCSWPVDNRRTKTNYHGMLQLSDHRPRIIREICGFVPLIYNNYNCMQKDYDAT